jgi:uncharacterized protein YggE
MLSEISDYCLTHSRNGVNMPRKRIAKTAFSFAIATLMGLATATIGQATETVVDTVAIEQNLISIPSDAADGAATNLHLAQAILPITSEIVSVTGTGRALAPVDQAALLLSYSSNYYPEPPSDPTAAPMLPPPAQESDLQPVVDALVGAGVARSDISFSREPYNIQAIRVVVRVANPTRERIQTLTQLAATTPTKNNKLTFGSNQVVLTARNCAETEARARQAAIAEARAQATALANDAGVRLGELVGISGYSMWGSGGPSGSKCPTDLDEALRYAAQFGVMLPYDSSQPLDVSIDYSVSVNYAMEE